MSCEFLESRQLLTVYAIDPVNGLDSNPGTLEAPFQTARNFSYAVSEGTDHYITLQAGDTVYLREGIHDWTSLLQEIPDNPDHPGAAMLLLGIHGTAAKPITITSYPGEHAVVTGREATQENDLLYVLQSSHVKISGLEVTGTYGNGIRVVESQHVEIFNNHVHGIDGPGPNNIAGVSLLSNIDVNVHHNLIHDNYDYAAAAADLAMPNSRNVVIFGDNSDQIRFHDNKVFNTPRADGHDTGAGVWVKHSSEIPGATIEIDHNIIQNVSFDGIGGQSHGVHTHHNLVVNSGAYTVPGGDNNEVHRLIVDRIQIENNTFINTPGFHINLLQDYNYPDAGFMTFRNNIVTSQQSSYNQENGIVQLDPYGTDASYTALVKPANLGFDDNVYYNGVTAPLWNVFSANGGKYGTLGANYTFAGWQQLGMDAHSILANPQLTPDYQPLNSAAVNAGWLSGEGPKLTMLATDDVVRQSEGAGGGMVTLFRSGMDLSSALTVSLTASDATELSVPGSVTFPAGVSRIQVPLTTVSERSDAPRGVLITAQTAAGLESSEWVRVFHDGGVALTAPVPTGPKAAVAEQRPALTWSPVSGATAYEISVKNISTGVMDAVHTTVSGTNYTPNIDLGIGLHAFRVRATGAGEDVGPWSTWFNFRINTPAQFNAIDPTQLTSHPALSWQPLKGSVRYDLWIDNLTTRELQIVRETSITGTTWSPSADLPLGRYKARVRGIDESGRVAKWSAATPFNIVTPPEITNKVKSTFDATPRINWTPVVGAQSYDVSFRNLSTGTVTTFNSGSNAGFASPGSDLTQGLYRVSVRARTATGFLSRWSGASDLYVGGRPTGIGPIGETGNLRPTFRWGSVLGAASYQLIVDRIDHSQRLISQSGITTTTFLSNQELAPGTYRFLVRAVSSNGKASPWSQPVNFSIAGRSRIGGTLPTTMPGAVMPSGSWLMSADDSAQQTMDRNFGRTGDQFVVGSWDGSMDQPGVVRQRPDGFLQWYLNADSAVSPVHETDFLFGLLGDTAVAGDWDGNGTSNAGVVRNNNTTGGLDWHLDLDQDPDAEHTQSFGLIGDIPVVGDWDNNGTDNVGVVRVTPSGFLEWHLDVTGDAWPEVSRIFGLAGDIPLVGDWDGNGKIDIGVARAGADGNWQWYRDLNGDPTEDLPVISFGSTTAKPVTGRWEFAEVQLFVVGKSGDQPLRGDGNELINFGTVVEGATAKDVSLVIQNTGTAALELTQLKLPQGFSVVDPLSASISPGGRDTLTIRLTTTVPGSFNGVVSFLTSDGNESSVQFRISGRVESIAPQMTVSNSVNLGEVISGNKPEATFTIQNPGNSPLQYSVALSNTQFEFVSGESGNIAAKSSATVIVRLKTTATGSRSATLTITSNSANVSAPVTRKVSATIVAAAPEMTVEGSGNFGTLGLNVTGLATERVFTITNRGNAPLEYSASINNSEFLILGGESGTVLPNGGMATVRVQIRSGSIGSKTATLMIQSNAVTSATQSKALSGSIIQGVAKISISGSGDFGTLARNASDASAERTFAVTNTGTAPLTLGSSVSNTNFSIVSGAGPITVAPGDTATLTIRMKVTTLGSKSAKLTITSNDPSNPTRSLTLSGTVVSTGGDAGSPEVSVKVGSTTLTPGQIGLLDYGAGPIAVQQQTFTITNSGTGVLTVSSPTMKGEFTHDLPASFTLQPGTTRTVTVKMLANSNGTKLGKLTFSTNDSDEGQITINLLGRQLPPVKIVPLSATSPVGGTYTISLSGEEPIFVDPSYGDTPLNGVLNITYGGTKHSFSSILSRIVIVSSNRPNVQNWTNVAVVWQSPTGTVALPGIEKRLELFGSL